MNDIKSVSIRKRQHSRRNVLAVLMDIELVAMVLEKAGIRVTHLLMPHEDKEKANDKPTTDKPTQY